MMLFRRPTELQHVPQDRDPRTFRPVRMHEEVERAAHGLRAGVVRVVDEDPVVCETANVAPHRWRHEALESRGELVDRALESESYREGAGEVRPVVDPRERLLEG